MNERTENVFEGGQNTDGRQDVTLVKPSRFRPTYRNLTVLEKELHDNIKTQAATLETYFEMVSNGREKSLAMTKLEEAVMWAVKALTA